MTTAASPARPDTEVVFDPATYTGGVPFEALARLRRDTPVAWVPEIPVLGWPEGPGFWLVLRHADVESVLSKIRPYVRTIDSSIDIQAMANGDICVALGYNGSFVQARNRAKEAKNGMNIGYVIPDEGSLLWFDMLAIPRDAPNAANAHLFINYLMAPQVIANISNFIGFANANSAASPLLEASIVADPIVYPPRDQQQRLFVQAEDSPEQSRAITRLWQKFKTAQ